MRFPLILTLLALVPEPAIESPTKPVESLVITRVLLVESRQLEEDIVEDTYRAELTHLALAGTPDYASVAAHLVRPDLTRPGRVDVVDGDVTFGPIRRGRTVISRDTFAIRRHHGTPLKLNQLRWVVSGRPDFLAPEGWAGTWRFTISWTAADSGRTLAIDTITTGIGADDPIGFSLLPDSVGCSWDGGEQSISGNCASASTTLLSGPTAAHFAIDWNGDVLSGLVSWQGAASVACGSLLDITPKDIKIAATRISTVATGTSSSGLLTRLVTYPPFIRLIRGISPA